MIVREDCSHYRMTNVDGVPEKTGRAFVGASCRTTWKGEIDYDVG